MRKIFDRAVHTTIVLVQRYDLLLTVFVHFLQY